MQDKRDETRIPLDQLPDNLKNVILSIGRLDEHEATIVNASKSGIGVLVHDVDLTDVNLKEHVTVTIYPEKIKLKGIVVYTHTVSNDERKIGISFVNARSIINYMGLLE
jgi:hypothetical protein